MKKSLSDGLCNSGDITSKPMPVRRKFEFKTAVPDGYGAVVAMCEFKGNIFVACQYAICVLTDDNTFKRLEFKEETDGTEKA